MIFTACCLSFFETDFRLSWGKNDLLVDFLSFICTNNVALNPKIWYLPPLGDIVFLQKWSCKINSFPLSPNEWIIRKQKPFPYITSMNEKLRLKILHKLNNEARMISLLPTAKNKTVSVTSASQNTTTNCKFWTNDTILAYTDFLKIFFIQWSNFMYITNTIYCKTNVF